jgi:L-2-hydroxycarboxylate dehydrogenase (NAD+)
LQNSSKAPVKDRIFVAGEKEYYKGLEIREKGIPINDGLLNNIKIMINELGLDKQKKIFE